jgi:hypothetical protein
MIESLMLCGIGLLAGCLLMLLFFPAVHQRAVRLTRRDLIDATPLTAKEIQAQKDQGARNSPSRCVASNSIWSRCA